MWETAKQLIQRMEDLACHFRTGIDVSRWEGTCISSRARKELDNYQLNKGKQRSCNCKELHSLDIKTEHGSRVPLNDFAGVGSPTPGCDPGRILKPVEPKNTSGLEL